MSDTTDRQENQMTMTMTEPDYTLTIIEQDGGFVVCEGGEQISKPFEDRREAELWLNQHQLWYQPQCVICGSAIPRPDDPWECVGSSCSTGADYAHKSCWMQFEYWADTDRKPEPGPQLVPPMEVIDAAWKRRTS
jgi:hypothetical protein